MQAAKRQNEMHSHRHASSDVRYLSDNQTMRKRILPIDLVALLLLAVAIFFPGPRGLHDFKRWIIQTVVTVICIFTMALHFVSNATLFNRPFRYLRLSLDGLVLVTALLWQLNLLIGLQGMS
jgi:cation transport ATPase